MRILLLFYDQKDIESFYRIPSATFNSQYAPDKTAEKQAFVLYNSNIFLLHLFRNSIKGKRESYLQLEENHADWIAEFEKQVADSINRNKRREGLLELVGEIDRIWTEFSKDKKWSYGKANSPNFINPVSLNRILTLLFAKLMRKI